MQQKKVTVKVLKLLGSRFSVKKRVYPGCAGS